MTNEQLRLLIRAYADRLELEIDNARAQLPEDAERMTHTDREYVGDSFIPVFDDDPRSWKETERSGEFVALLGLINFLSDLRQADEDLTQVKEESAP